MATFQSKFNVGDEIYPVSKICHRFCRECNGTGVLPDGAPCGACRRFFKKGFRILKESADKPWVVGEIEIKSRGRYSAEETVRYRCYCEDSRKSQCFIEGKYPIAGHPLMARALKSVLYKAALEDSISSGEELSPNG